MVVEDCCTPGVPLIVDLEDAGRAVDVETIRSANGEVALASDKACSGNGCGTEDMLTS